MGFRVWGLGVRLQAVEFRVQGIIGFGVWGWGVGMRVEGSGFRVWGLGFRV